MSQNHRTEQPPAVVMGAREQPEQMLEIPVEYAAHPRKPVKEPDVSPKSVLWKSNFREKANIDVDLIEQWLDLYLSVFLLFSHISDHNIGN